MGWSVVMMEKPVTTPHFWGVITCSSYEQNSSAFGSSTNVRIIWYYMLASPEHEQDILVKSARIFVKSYEQLRPFVTLQKCSGNNFCTISAKHFSKASMAGRYFFAK